MSTRATYRFDASQVAPAITYYIHHDGYLEGAASYFKDAVLHPNPRGGLVAMFLRANDNAEFTHSHQTHADTEFRYTLKPDTHELVAEKRYQDPETWGTVFRGPLIEFIHQYEGTQLVRYHGEYLDRERAGARILAKLADLKHALENKWTGNASSYATEVWGLNQLLIQTYGADEFTTTTAATIDSADHYFALAYGWADNEQGTAYQRWVAQFRTPKPTTGEPQA